MRFTTLALSVAMLLLPTGGLAFPWSIDMYREQAVQPLARAPRVMPPGTTPVQGGEAPRSRIASIRLRNPLPATAENIERGRQLYAITCEPCHGADGRGDGPVKFLLRVPPIDLTGESATGMSDGYIYGTIRDGSVIMPPYADALSINERWEVVLFVRSLQGKLAAK
jgi:mono/diheme cytochrome c family protein